MSKENVDYLFTYTHISHYKDTEIKKKKKVLTKILMMLNQQLGQDTNFFPTE